MRSAEAELHLQINVSASELSINALVETLDRLEGELFASLVDVLQQRHLEAVQTGEAPPVGCPRCGSERWVKRGSRPRQLKTRRGELAFALRQVTCRACGWSWSPFVERLGLAPHQRTTEGLRRRLVGLATETSYEKASRWGEQAMGTTLSPMTLWRTVQRRAQELRFTPSPLSVDRRYPEARAQRCAWHLVFKLDQHLWRGEWPKADRDRVTRELYEHVFGPEPPRATRRVAMWEWAESCISPGSIGHGYIEGAIERIGYAEPSTLRTTAHAERAMRELNRRTDIGAVWTLEGIGNLVRLRLARRHNPNDYDRVWSDQVADELTSRRR